MQKGLYQMISQALASEWMIDRRYAESYLSVVKTGNLVAENFGKKEDKMNLVGHASDGKVYYPGKFDNAPEGTVAILSVEGALMRADGPCSFGTASLVNMLKYADRHKNISSIILEIDSPGGQVIGTEVFANAIRDCSKDVYVMGHLMASAAYWIGSQAKEIWASGLTSEFGSIGTMIFYIDMLPILEKEGAVVHEVYASKSTDKNALFNQIVKGNYEPYIKQKLNPLNEIFQASVRSARKLADSEMTGKTYLAQEAMDLGLIDRIGSMDELIQHISSVNSEKSHLHNSNHKEMAEDKNSFWSWLPSASASTKAEKQNELEALRASHEEGMNKISELEAKLKEANSKAEKDSQTIEAKNQKIEELKQQLAEKDEELKAANELAEQYGKQPGAMPSVPQKKGQDVPQSDSKTPDWFDADAEHNQDAAEYSNKLGK